MNSQQSYHKKEWTTEEVRQALQQYRKRWKRALGIASVGLLVSIAINLWLGSVAIPAEHVAAIVLHALTGWKITTWEAAHQTILWDIRLPRIVASVLTGSGLAMAGAAMQAILRNPLASPYLLGVSSGASLGASLVMLLGWAGSWLLVPLGAFGGALLALFAVLLLGQSHHRVATERLILAGVAISALLGALTSFVLWISPAQGMREIIFWTLGSFQRSSWQSVGIPAFSVLIGGWLFARHANTFNAMLMGEETARTLGVHPSRLRRQMFVVVSLVAASLVAMFGVIGFVGLMVPHIVRLWVGNDYQRVLPASAICGGVFMVWTDAASRLIFAPLEIPLGIITALVGAPFFLWLMHRSKV